MAHVKCAAGKVWPPAFRPALDPNEVLRQIHALLAHFAQLSSGLPIPQVLPVVLQQVVPPSPQPEAMEWSEEKHEEPVAVTESEQPPTNNQQQPTSNQPTKLTNNQPPTTKKTSKKGEKKSKPIEKNEVTATNQNKPTENVFPLTNQNTMREYSLQQDIKAVGGKTILLQDNTSKFHQFRCRYQGIERQFTHVQEHAECPLKLDTWQQASNQDVRCRRCGKTRSKRGARPNSFRSWRCHTHDYDICFTCDPVVLRTPDRTESMLNGL